MRVAESKPCLPALTAALAVLVWLGAVRDIRRRMRLRAPRRGHQHVRGDAAGDNESMMQQVAVWQVTTNQSVYNCIDWCQVQCVVA
jgi:hypothetical protein